MNQKQLFQELIKATQSDKVASLIDSYVIANTEAKWVPVGRENNRGTIEASSDPGRSLIERLTNGIDAVLESEHERHKGIPECSSPREAAHAWLGVPIEGLSKLTTHERQQLANRVSIHLQEGDGDWNRRLVTVEDHGTGILPEQIPKTILSLSESNKIKKRYVVGAYGQGGSSTFACSNFTIIASRYVGSELVGFTIVKYYEPPPDDESKVGNYVYLTSEGSVLMATIPVSIFPVGTRVWHFGYDLTKYNASLGPTSIYGLLNSVLFDPVIPVWLSNDIHKYRRVIKGSRNALNGAVDAGDENKNGPTISHSLPMFYVDIGDFGSIGVEYWVLEPSDTNKQPIRSFVDPGKPIVLTLHGQSHAEMSQVLVRKGADLPYLRQRIICHVDCNRLAPVAKRLLFVSNREEARRGHVYNRIEEEVVKAFKSDDDLTRLNDEARERGLQQQDQEAQKQMQSEVARLLRLHGMNVEMVGGTQGNATGDSRPARTHGARPKPAPIATKEPPSYIRIIWEESEPIPFYPEQSRYLRIETDADSRYHNPSDQHASRLNFILDGKGLAIAGTTPLKGGRMRVIVRCDTKAELNATGIIRVEMARAGMPTLSDERTFRIVTPPPAQQAKKAVSVPRIDPRPIDPHHAQWAILDWPTDDMTHAASSSEMEDGTLVVWYSTVYPSYAKEIASLEQRDPVLAKSFNTRYAIWLAVHSLLLQESETDTASIISGHPLPEGTAEDFERIERCRIARMAAMIASREIRDIKGSAVESE